jgi:hypothetical protein
MAEQFSKGKGEYGLAAALNAVANSAKPKEPLWKKIYRNPNARVAAGTAA